VGAPVGGKPDTGRAAVAVMIVGVDEEAPAVLLEMSADIAAGAVGLRLGVELAGAEAGIDRIAGDGVAPGGVDLGGKAGRF